MAISGPNRNWLIGLSAWERGLLTREDLLVALRAFAASPRTPLGPILEEHSRLTRAGRALAESRAMRHLTEHRGDELACLASFQPRIDELLAKADPGLRSRLRAMLPTPLTHGKHQKRPEVTTPRRTTQIAPRSSSKTRSGSCAGPACPSLLEEPAVGIGAGLLLLVMLIAGGLYRENVRLRAEVSRLEQDNQLWQRSFRTESDSIHAREVVHRARLIELTNERDRRRVSERALAKANDRLGRLICLTEHIRDHGQGLGPAPPEPIASDSALLSEWHSELEQATDRSDATVATLARIERLQGQAACERGSSTEAILAFESAERRFASLAVASPAPTLFEEARARVLLDLGSVYATSGAKAEAIEAIRRARDLWAHLGRFIDPGSLPLEPGFATLREDADFQGLLAELRDRTFPADPFATDALEGAGPVARR